MNLVDFDMVKRQLPEGWGSPDTNGGRYPEYILMQELKKLYAGKSLKSVDRGNNRMAFEVVDYQGRLFV